MGAAHQLPLTAMMIEEVDNSISEAVEKWSLQETNVETKGNAEVSTNIPDTWGKPGSGSGSAHSIFHIFYHFSIS